MQLVLVIALLVAMGSFVTAAPAVAVGGDDNMCEPFTRSNLGPPPAETTTTTAVDLVDGGRARGGARDAEAPGDDTAVIDDPPTTRPPRNCAPFVYEMEFPLLGAGAYWSGFGAPRDGGRRSHMGVDIAAPQMTPVVAVADGMVSRINIDSGTAGTYIALDHDDDWSSWYLHLNNDHYGTDDGRGIGVRPDLEAGDRVTAGEVIGWVGDSGNAETTEPHLHFEVHLPSGEPIDPYDSLLAAEADGAAAFVIDPTQVLTEQTEAGGTIDLVSSRIDTAAPRPGFAGPFVDDDGTAAEAAFNRLAALGARAWCDEWGVRVCPESEVTGADAEAWIEALVGTSRDPSVAIAYQPTDLDPSLNRSEIVACGINTLCADQPVSYGEVAAMIIGATDGTSVLSPADAASTLTRIGVAGCGGPQSADRTLTRAEFAGLLLQVTGIAPHSNSCGQLS